MNFLNDKDFYENSNYKIIVRIIRIVLLLGTGINWRFFVYFFVNRP